MDWWEEDLEGGRFGDYRIEKKLGEGGMAEVFLAEGLPSGLHSGRRVAIKVPLLAQVAPASLKYLLARFEKEVRLQSTEPTAGVVTMLGAGETRDRRGVARPYLVMEYLTGGTLADRLGQREPLLENRRARLQTLEEVLEWLPPIARTLDALHRCTPQRLHRDVKPENILFNGAGDPFLSDFGIATLLDDEASGSLYGSRTSFSESPGSSGYQAPEVFSGEKLAASDQFSLGVTVYEAMSGYLPIRFDSRDTYKSRMAKWNPTPLHVHRPELDGATVQAVMKAISGDPAGRHINCMAFARELHRVVNAGGQAKEHIKPEPPPSRPPPTGRFRLVDAENGRTLCTLDIGGAVTVGREPPADVCLQESEISKQHARFGIDDKGQIWVEDLGSTNGVWFGPGKRLRSGRTKLQRGQIVYLADKHHPVRID